jgi:uncharacterized protein
MKYVFFHGNCYDGFGAAFAAWKKLGDTAKYIPVSYGKEHVTDIQFQPEDVVYIVDYSVSNEEFEKLTEMVSEVVILDHHKTALERFTGLAPYPDPEFKHWAPGSLVYFNMNESGALITWRYFHPDKPVPRLIQWISDRDLWQFKLPETKSIHALLTSKKMDFATWDDLMQKGEGSYWHHLAESGAMLLEQQDRTVEMICKKHYFTTIAGYEVPIVNVSSHWSEVGNKLVSMFPQAPFAASYTDQPDGTRMYSLRSNGFDVAAVAQLFGGGGHKQAAGFNIPIVLQPAALSEKK